MFVRNDKEVDGAAAVAKDDEEDDDDDDVWYDVVRVVSKALNWKFSTKLDSCVSLAFSRSSLCCCCCCCWWYCGKAAAVTSSVFWFSLSKNKRKSTAMSSL